MRPQRVRPRQHGPQPLRDAELHRRGRRIHVVRVRELELADAFPLCVTIRCAPEIVRYAHLRAPRSSRRLSRMRSLLSCLVEARRSPASEISPLGVRISVSRPLS